MGETLLLRLPQSDGEPATWVIAGPPGASPGPPQAGPLALAAPRAAGRRVVVLAPGADVLLAEPDVPAKAGAKLPQLVPYALEEHLAEDIDSQHFAIGRRRDGSTRVPVAVVARALLDEWLVMLRAAGIEPDAVHADSDLVPANPGQAVAFLEGDRVCVRAAGAAPVTLPGEAIGEALRIAQAAGSPTGARGLLVYATEADWRRYEPAIEAARAQFDGIAVQLLTGGSLGFFAQQLPLAHPVNLLQGAYAPASGVAVGMRAWRTAAMLLACLVGLHVAGKVVELQVLKKREHQVDASMRDAFHSALPGEPLTADPRRVMESRLAVVRGAGSGLLPALQALAQARDAVPGTALLGVNFHGGALELKLTAPDAASLDRLSQTLRERGWDAALAGGGNAGAAYEGRIELHPRGT